MDDAKFQTSLLNEIQDDVCILTPIYFMNNFKTDQFIYILFISSFLSVQDL